MSQIIYFSIVSCCIGISLSMSAFAKKAFSSHSDWSLSTIMEQAEFRHPELQSARFLLAEAEARVIDSGLKSAPRLEISSQINPNLREAALQIGVSQAFPTTQRLRWERARSERELDQVRAEWLLLVQKVRHNARESAIELHFAQAKLQLFEKQILGQESWRKDLQAAHQQGEVSILDLNVLTLECQKLQLKKSQAAIQEKEFRRRLQWMLGLKQGIDIQISSQEIRKLPKHADKKSRAEVDVAEAALKSAEAEIPLAYSKRYEDVEAGLFLGLARQEDFPRGRENDASIGLQVKIPFPWWNKHTGAAKEADAKQERRQLELNSLQEKIQQEIDASSQAVTSTEQNVQRLEQTLIPLAQEQVKQTQSTYLAGLIDFQLLFRAKEQLQQLELTHLEALRELVLAQAQAASSQGE